MFYFVVRHFRWLACVPLLPQLFDAILLAHTSIVHRPRLRAMEMLEAGMLRQSNVSLKVHHFGGTEFVREDGIQLGHLHGHGLLDVLVGSANAATLVATRQARPHHIFPNSSWVSFQIESESDVPFALELFAMAQARIPASKELPMDGSA